MPKKSKFNILSINQEERSSRFVVDLKKASETDEILEKSISKKIDIWKKISSFTFSRSKDIKTSDEEGALSENKKDSQNKLNDFYKEKLDQLAFLSLGKFVVIAIIWASKWFYKFCYFLGWGLFFLMRFTGLILANFFCFVGERVYKIYAGIKTIIQVFLRSLEDLFLQFFSEIKKFFNILYQLSKYFFKKSTSRRKKEDSQPEAISKEDDEVYFPVDIKFSWKRSVAFFALALLVIILPFKIFAYYKTFDLESLKGRVLGASEIALGDLTAASQSATQLNFDEASDNFSKAGENFLEAQKQVSEINDVFFSLASLAPGGEIKLASEGKKILVAGQVASSLGENLSLAMKSLFENKDKDILGILNSFTEYGKITAAEASDLDSKLKEIDINSLPSEYKEKFLFLQEKTEILKNGLTQFVDLADKLRIFLGANQDKRYLLVFQNNTELRATGGFIGSFALVDFKDGKIRNIEAPGGGSYDTEGGLRELVTAPQPLSLVNPLWHFWDANWWPDWPTSARKLMWFYERSDGPTVDGVISFTPTVLEKLLEVTGPIDMSEDYGVTLTAENFWEVTQAIVEKKPVIGEENKPKKIIGELMDKIITELPVDLNKEKLVKLLSLTEKSLSEKQILFYFTDEKLQAEIENRGWDGEIRQTSRDYLSVINTNIAGGKSDKKIQETINQTTEIMPNGSIINTVKITRKHTGEKGESFVGVRNVDWMRVYVPAGSELLEAQGFRKPDEIYFEKPDESWKKDSLVYQEETTSKIHELSGTRIYEEEDKTVFANWTMVDPGESTVIYLKYKLPFVLEEDKSSESFWNKIKNLINFGGKELFPYALLAQKQSGSLGSEINSDLKLPDNFKIVWKYPNDLNLSDNGWQVNSKLDTDKYWAVLLEKQN